MGIDKDIMPIEVKEIKIKIDPLVEIDIVEIDIVETGIDPQVDPQGDIIGIIEIMIGMEVIGEIEVIPGKGMIVKRIRGMVKAISTIPI